MTTNTTAPDMTVQIIHNDRSTPPGKLADAELHFTGGPLDGLKLIGFGIWERRAGGGRNVTFPARQYSVNGERRSFALLRPIADAASTEPVRDLILAAYAEHERRAAEPQHCPDCRSPLTDRTATGGRPSYCDACDREASTHAERREAGGPFA